jgi:hypothetical protein
MANNSIPFISRRGLLKGGLLAGLLGAAGCGEPGVTTVTTPAVEKGNRNRLDALREKAEQAALKNKNKKRR